MAAERLREEKIRLGFGSSNVKKAEGKEDRE